MRQQNSPNGGSTMGNEPNGICGIVAVGGGVPWAAVGLNGAKLKTGGAFEADAEDDGGTEEDGGATPEEGAWTKTK